MPTLTIRNLPMEVMERLKARAKQNGRSMEREAREILGQRLASRSELLSEMRARWDDIAVPPSAAEVSGWIRVCRHERLALHFRAAVRND